MDQLDNFVKKKLEERPFEMKEAWWQQASEMIDAREKKKRRRIFFWFLIGFASGLAVFFLFKQNEKETAALAIEKAEQTYNESSTTPTAPKRIESVFPKEKSNDPSAPEINLHEVPVQAPTTVKNSIQKEQKSGDLANKQIPSDQAIKKDIKQTTNKHSQIDHEESTKEVSTAVISKQEDFIETNRRVTFNFEALPIHFNYLTIRNRPIQFNLLPLEKKEHKVVNTLPVSLLFNTTYYPYSNANKKQIGYVLGVNYEYLLNTRWSLEGGIHYRKRTGSFYNIQESQQISFRFSKIESRYFLEPSSLHYAEVPLSILYKHKRHNIMAGATYSHLLGIQGSLFFEKNDELGSVTEVVEKGWIQNYGFKRQHVDLHLGYYFSLSRRFSLGANANYTLGSLLENGFEAPVEYYYRESEPLFIDFGLKLRLF